MIYLLGGYLWLYVHRPFEVWPALGDLQIERGYMLLMLVAWLVTPKKTFTPNAVHVGIAGFAFAVLATWLLSPYGHLPACNLTVETWFKVAVFYFLLVTTVADEKSLRQLLRFFLISVTLYASHSLFEYMNGRYEHRMATNRMIGVDTTFRDPNAFASGMLLPLVVSLVFWLETPRKVPRYLLLGCGGLFSLCILLTGSRSGFMGLCLVVAALPFLFLKSRFLAFGLLAAMGIVGFVGLLAMPGDLQNRYLTIIDPSVGPKNAQVSAEGRLAGLYHGTLLFQKSPLFGTGPGSFAQASGLGFQPHNLYGQVMGEMGMMGIIALLVLLAAFALNVRAARALAREIDGPTEIGPVRSSLSYQVTIVVGLCVVILLLQGMGGHNLYRYYWQWLAAFQVAAMGCLRKYSPLVAVVPAEERRALAELQTI